MFMWRETSLHGELVFLKDELYIVGIKIQNPFAQISTIKCSARDCTK